MHTLWWKQALATLRQICFRAKSRNLLFRRWTGRGRRQREWEIEMLFLRRTIEEWRNRILTDEDVRLFYTSPDDNDEVCSSGNVLCLFIIVESFNEGWSQLIHAQQRTHTHTHIRTMTLDWSKHSRMPVMDVGCVRRTHGQEEAEVHTLTPPGFYSSSQLTQSITTTSYDHNGQHTHACKTITQTHPT